MKKVFIALCLIGVSAAHADCPELTGRYSCRTENEGRVYEQELHMSVAGSGVEVLSMVSDGVDFGDIPLDSQVRTSTETVNGVTYVHDVRGGCLPVVDVVHIVRGTTVPQTQVSTRIVHTMYPQADGSIFNAVARFDANDHRTGSRDFCTKLKN